MTGLKGDITGIALGIRFKRSFRMLDITGNIMDEILFGKRTPFGDKFFLEVVHENSGGGKILRNKETNDYLRVNTDDIILVINFPKNDFRKKFEWVRESVVPYFEEHLFKEYDIKNVLRIGVVFTHRTKQMNGLEDIPEILTDKNVLSSDDLNISFSTKDPVSQSLIKKGVNDYRKQIYNFSKVGDEIMINLDYQHYFEPMLADFRDCAAKKFLREAEEFLEKNFYKWVKKS